MMSYSHSISINKHSYQKFIFSIFLMSFLTTAKATGQKQIEMSTGYNGGIGLGAHLIWTNFARSAPFDLQFGLGYSSFDPGNAADARRIFINNATNGFPEESGHRWDYRLDFLIRSSMLPRHGRFFLGPRYTSFTGNFKYVGGNEDFDVVSSHWGVGAGYKAFYQINRAWTFSYEVGLDYFFKSELTGHDTVYSPDGEHSNPRENYTYTSADDSINQPKWEPRIMVGVSYFL